MVRRATSAKNAVTRVAKKVTAKLRRKKATASAPAASGTTQSASKKRSAKASPKPMARKRKPQADIPIDSLQKAYTPSQTSLKAPFRASGADRQRDQEFGRGIADDRWNDEDHLTNKSGDSRIGTRGRTYEPGEKRLASKGRK